MNPPTGRRADGPTKRRGGRWAVGLCVAVVQSIALAVAVAVAAAVANSAALKTRTATNPADVAVGVFLLIGVVSSVRPADESHPLGYHREWFFSSFVAAAVGVFIGGVGTAAVETPRAAAHPEPTGSYTVGYAVPAVIMLLDALAPVSGLRPLLQGARERYNPLTAILWRGTDPAVTTVVLGGAAGLVGGLIAAAGLAGRELTGEAAADALASGLIGLVLLATRAALPNTNRELLTGRAAAPAGAAHRPGCGTGRHGPHAADGGRAARRPGRARPVRDRRRPFQRDRRRGCDLRGRAQRPPGRGDDRTRGRRAASPLARWPAIAYVHLNPVAEHRHRRLAPYGDLPPGQP